MRFFFGGAEVPSHRKVLIESEAPEVALSYLGLRRKVKFRRPWLLHEKFPDGMQILLDSGAYSVNSNEEQYSLAELREISTGYQQFVLQNIERVQAVTEFDALALGADWIDQQRGEFYDKLPPEVFIPIWHPEWGLDELTGLAEVYPRVGISATTLNGRNLVPFLNSLVNQFGTKFHGVAITGMEDMQQVRWDSVSSTSWISPQRFGDTIIWTGNELKRYPKKYKEQARKQHRAYLEREGFDAQAIEDDDSNEVLRLSIWSWRKFVDDIDKHQRPRLTVVTPQPESVSQENVEEQPPTVDTQPEDVRNSVPTKAVVKQRDPMPLPVLGFVTVSDEQVDPETGESTVSEHTDLRIRSDSARRCAACHLAGKCPAYDPEANCAYNIPIEVKTKQEFVSLQNAIIEIQTHRVMFMKYAEDLDGGYADPNLSSEIDRLQKMLKTKHDMETDGFSFRVDMKATGNAQTGMLSRLFGNELSAPARMLPQGPLLADDILDAEFTEE